MVLCFLIIINLFSNFNMISKLIIITNRCQYLAVFSLLAEINVPHFFELMSCGFCFELLGEKKETQNDKVYFEPNMSSIIHSTNIY